MSRREKRKREDIPELNQADEIAEEQLIKPTGTEKSALSAFCTYSLQCKVAEAQARALVQNIKPKLKLLRQQLIESLGDATVLKIPNTSEEIPKYIRLTKNSKDLTITSDILKEAFQQLIQQPEDLLENEQEDLIESVVSVILSHVRRLVRSYQEQAKLTDSLPRGTKAADVPVANKDTIKQAMELHTQSSFVLNTEKQKREKIAVAKMEMAKREPSVDAFFVRSNMSSQRVTLENAPYNLCRRTSMIKPKITFKVLEQLLKEELSTQLTELTGGSKNDFLASGAVNQLERGLVTKVATLPGSVKTVIHLQKLAQR